MRVFSATIGVQYSNGTKRAGYARGMVADFAEEWSRRASAVSEARARTQVGGVQHEQTSLKKHGIGKDSDRPALRSAARLVAIVG